MNQEKDLSKKYERQTAYKVHLANIHHSTYHKKEGWESNYLEIYNQKVSRVNIMGTVTKTEESSIQIDDGTALISVRTFDNPEIFQGLEVGEIINIIGKPREFNQEMYLNAEIINKTNQGWLQYRLKEIEFLSKKYENSKPAQKVEKIIEEEVIKEDNETDSIIKLIQDHDTGNGAEIEQIINLSANEKTEKIIQNLLLNGDIFEIRPGFVKVLI